MDKQQLKELQLESESESESCYKVTPPQQAFFYFPDKDDIINENKHDPFKSRRILFEGNLEYTDFEQNQLKELKKDILSYNNKENKENKQNCYDKLILQNSWPDAETLRFHQFTSYNSTKTISLLKDYVKWRSETDKIIFSEKILEILNTGFVYCYGRDCKFRPVIYYNLNNYKKHCKKYTDEELEEAIIYLMEYIIKNLMIPGQVENFITITLKGDYSIFQIPPVIKKLIATLSNNYARLHKGYILGLSGLMTYLWSFVGMMVDESTKKKIALMDDSMKDLIFEQLNKDQVEKIYGGNAEDIKEGEFFPPKYNNENFLLDEDSSGQLLTERTYCDKVMKDDRIVRSPYKKKYSIKINTKRQYSLYLQYNNSIFTNYLVKKSQVYNDHMEKVGDSENFNSVSEESKDRNKDRGSVDSIINTINSMNTIKSTKNLFLSSVD